MNRSGWDLELLTPAIPDRVYPPQVQILSELGRLFGKAALLVGQTFAVAVVDQCGVYWLLREPPEPPCIWRDLFGASRRCIVLPSVSADVWPPPTALYRQDNQLFDGTSAGFPLMYPASCSLASSLVERGTFSAFEWLGFRGTNLWDKRRSCLTG